MTVYSVSYYYQARATRFEEREKEAREALKAANERLIRASSDVQQTERDLKEYSGIPFIASQLSRMLALEKEVENVRHTETRQLAAVAVHFAELRLKYQRAVLYPWMPIAPDPPSPARQIPRSSSLPDAPIEQEFVNRLRSLRGSGMREVVAEQPRSENDESCIAGKLTAERSTPSRPRTFWDWPFLRSR
jgi:hypothetical protein